mgnify:CR=1 FL=1
MCRAAGYDEIITYSFISPTYYDKIDLPKDSPLRDSLKILNPLGEDTSIMRTTTLPSMLEILTRNYNFRNKSAKLYELDLAQDTQQTGIAPGKKSVAFNLTLRADDRSLTAEEADADVKSILTALEQECGAVLR